jgi:hypothetical protein
MPVVAAPKWSSKLGDWEDVEHTTLEALEGDFYGKAGSGSVWIFISFSGWIVPP